MGCDVQTGKEVEASLDKNRQIEGACAITAGTRIKRRKLNTLSLEPQVRFLIWCGGVWMHVCPALRCCMTLDHGHSG